MGNLNVRKHGVRNTIQNSWCIMDKKGIIPSSTLTCKVGNGTSILFWSDTWCDGIALVILFHVLFCKDRNHLCLVSDRWQDGQ